MKPFWEGFSKRASTKDDDAQFALQVAAVPSGIASGAAGITVAMPVSDVTLAADEKLGPLGARKLVKDIDRKVGYGYAPDIAFYLPDNNTVYTGGKMSTPAMIAHEVGHSKTTKNIIGRLRLLYQALHGGFRVGNHYYPGWTIPAAILPTAAATHEKTEEAAPYLGLAYASPVLLDEAQASLVGAYHLAKKRGLKAMARGAIPMLGAFGTYAAVPLASGIAAKYITHLKRKDKKKDESS